jgi:hypothetical protein
MAGVAYYLMLSDQKNDVEIKNDDVEIEENL